MIQVWLYSLLSVIVVSLISFIGVFTLSVSLEKLKKVILFFISFAAGTLLGDAFIHLLPESFKVSRSTHLIGAMILAGLMMFFIMEKILKWRHCHEPTSEEHPHPVGMMNLVGDGVHNFLDGVIIGVSYLASLPLGFATTIAVIMHEIPQEIGDFSVLLHAGFPRGRALFYNFLSALTAVLGAVITLIIGVRVTQLTGYLIPLTMGGFIYIATADLIPELHKEVRLRYSIFQLVSFLGGIGLMGLLLLID